jgi:hypothetical protein
MPGDFIDVDVQSLDLSVHRPKCSKLTEKKFSTDEEKQNEVKKCLSFTYFKANVSKRCTRACFNHFLYLKPTNNPGLLTAGNF